VERNPQAEQPVQVHQNPLGDINIEATMEKVNATNKVAELTAIATNSSNDTMLEAVIELHDHENHIKTRKLASDVTNDATNLSLGLVEGAVKNKASEELLIETQKILNETQLTSIKIPLEVEKSKLATEIKNLELESKKSLVQSEVELKSLERDLTHDARQTVDSKVEIIQEEVKLDFIKKEEIRKASTEFEYREMLPSAGNPMAPFVIDESEKKSFWWSVVKHCFKFVVQDTLVGIGHAVIASHFPTQPWSYHQNFDIMAYQDDVYEREKSIEIHENKIVTNENDSIIILGEPPAPEVYQIPPPIDPHDPKYTTTIINYVPNQDLLPIFNWASRLFNLWRLYRLVRDITIDYVQTRKSTRFDFESISPLAAEYPSSLDGRTDDMALTGVKHKDPLLVKTTETYSLGKWLNNIWTKFEFRRKREYIISKQLLAILLGPRNNSFGLPLEEFKSKSSFAASHTSTINYDRFKNLEQNLFNNTVWVAYAKRHHQDQEQGPTNFY